MFFTINMIFFHPLALIPFRFHLVSQAFPKSSILPPFLPKVCLLSVSALLGGLAQTARSLTVLVSTCARTATVEEGCAASIETLLVPVTLFINGGIAISAACDKGQQRAGKKG